MSSAEPRGRPSPLRIRWFARGALALLAITTRPRIARGDVLAVSTSEFGSWPASVAALQSDVHSEGREIHVVVADTAGRRVTCGNYTLTLDAVSSAAFVVGACDASTHATAIRVAHRAGLFARGDIVSQPLSAGISATQVNVGRAQGGASASGGTEVHCSLSVRPYLSDLEHGTRVYLTADRYALRSVTTAVRVEPLETGWMLHSGVQSALSVEYEVVDTATHATLIHDRVSLACGTAPVTAAPTALPSAAAAIPPSPGGSEACPLAPELVPGAIIQSTTVGAHDSFHAACAHGAGGGDRIYTLRVATLSQVTVRLIADPYNPQRWLWSPALYLRPDCSNAADELLCGRHNAFVTSGGTPYVQHMIVTELPRGTYYVVVDGDATRPAPEGPFRLSATVTPVIRDVPASSAPETLACTQARELALGNPVGGSTVRRGDRFHSRSGGGSGSPDVVYTLRVADPVRLTLRLASDFDGALAIRSACSLDAELAYNDDGPDTRHSRLVVDLAPGVYFVIVDGSGANQSGSYLLSATGQPPWEAEFEAAERPG